MVEVFKTTVKDAFVAKKLIGQIHQHFEGYHANFDLEDCDRILRIKNPNGAICAHAIILLLERNGYAAEVLEDDLTLFGK
jgi:hypothetical protein